MSKGSAIVSILIALVGGILIGSLINLGGSSDDDGEDITAEADGESAVGSRGAADDLNAGRPFKGGENALVTIVEISDFECPFCSRVNPTMEQIEREYGDRVRIVWRNNPLPMHPNAPAAHNAAMEVFQQGGNEKFWRYHDLLFQNQRALTRENLERWAQEVGGIDMAQFRRALDSNEHQALIAEDQQFASRAGAQGTPNFIVNGQKVEGAQPFEAFKRAIDAEMEQAQALVRQGTPANRVFASRFQAAFGSGSPTAAGAAQPPPQQPQRRPDPAAVYRVPVDGQPQKGPDDALVTIVEVSEFECPFCSRVLPTVTRIREEYGNDVRIVWRNNPLPFHSNATPAAQAALEIFEQRGNDAFWRFHDLAFENQRALTRENFEAWAGQVGGINMAQFRAALDANEHQAIIDADQALARSLGATGTPSFFINGRNLRGAQPFEAFKAVIDEELAKARRLVESGTPRARLYAAIIADGHTEQQFIGGDAAPAPAAPAEPPPDRVYEIAVPTDAPSKGPRNARIVIQEFSDFQCPFCSRVGPTIRQIEQEYGDRVRIVWRNYPLPFHEQAMPAAEAAMEVHRQGGDEKFWAYHDLIFQNQQQITRENLEAWAGQVGGINMGEFRAALDSRRHQARVQADMDAVSRAGAQIGTPSFFINGRLVQGAVPFEQFKTAIDAALAAR